MPKETQKAALGLRRIKLLDGLSNESLQALSNDCSWRPYKAGQTIISRNSPEHEVYLLVAGKVRVSMYSANGRQVTFRDVECGEILGDIAAIDGGRRSADAVALEDVLVAALSAEAFKKLLLAQPLVGERFLYRMTGLIRLLTDRVIELSTLGVQNRIHAEMLRLARHSGVQGNVSRITPAPKHADIASQISTTREQVTREMSELVRRGVLSKESGGLVVIDVRRLETMVQTVSDEGASAGHHNALH